MVSIINVCEVIIGENSFKHISVYEGVPRIEELHIISGGLRQTFIHRLINPPIRLTHAPGDVGGKLAHYLLASICGPSVNDEPFKISEGLPDDTLGGSQ